MMDVKEIAKKIWLENSDSDGITDLEEIIAAVAEEVAKEAVDVCYRVHKQRGGPPDCARAITAQIVDAARQ